MQQKKRKQDGQHGGGLVHRDDLVYIAKLERLEIAKPGGACGEAGKHEEKHGFPGQRGECSLRADEKHHHPGKQQHHDGADGGCDIGIRFAYAAFCKDGSDPREEC